MMKRSLLVGIVVCLLVSALPPNVRAAVVTDASLVLETMKESTASNQTITFTQTGGDQFQAGETITVTYPAGYNLSSLSSPLDFDFRVASTDETLRSASCGGSDDEIRVTISGQVITFLACGGYTAEAANAVIEIKIGTNATVGGNGSNKIINQTAAQNNTDPIVVIGGSEISGSIATEIVADNDATVNATVDPSITCSFSGLTTTFASLTTGAVYTSDTNTVITVSTNGSGGFGLTVRDEGNGTNPGLYKSTAPTYLVGSADNAFADSATLSAGVDGFGIQGSVSGGSGASVTIAARYNQSGNTVGGLERTATTLATASGPVANRAVTVVHKAAVSGLAPSGSYADTITYVCSGIF